MDTLFQNFSHICPQNTMQPYTIPLPLPTPHRLLPVPGGPFRIGNNDTEGEAEYDGKPAHDLELSPFLIGEYPTTQMLWQAVMGDNPAHFKGQMRPVENVSWFDAAVFCNRLSTMTGLKPCYRDKKDRVYGLRTDDQWELPNQGAVVCDYTANGYRLPTEAEWEYAARSGPDHLYSGAYSGSDEIEQVAWYRGNSDNQTHDVGLLLPNGLGLYDMSGNVLECCNDWYDKYPKAEKKNPRGPEEGDKRVLRGGSYLGGPHLCRAAYRFNFFGPYDRYHYFGFRLVLQSV
jgi:formylglycine-generating enzyme